MIHPNDPIATLIGSRICHDLISPVGALSNGVELLVLSGTVPALELSLISDSAAHASTKIKQFRLAFGMASDQVQIAADAVCELLSEVYATGPITLNWQASGDFPRSVGQMVVLGAMCAERALPYGGAIEITHTGDSWSITARSERIKVDPALWDILSGTAPASDLAPADVQFALLPRLAAAAGLSCTYEAGTSVVRLTF